MVTFIVFLVIITMVIIVFPVVLPVIARRLIVKSLSAVKKFVFFAYYEILDGIVSWALLYSDNPDRAYSIEFPRDYSSSETFRKTRVIDSNLMKRFVGDDDNQFIVKLFGEKYSILFDSSRATMPKMFVYSISLYFKYIRCLRGKDENFNNTILIGRERVIIELEERHSLLSAPYGAYERIMNDSDIWWGDKK